VNTSLLNGPSGSQVAGTSSATMREESARPASRSYFAGSGSLVLCPVATLTRKMFFMAQSSSLPQRPALAAG
jgi:hypothetical protein